MSINLDIWKIQILKNFGVKINVLSLPKIKLN